MSARFPSLLLALALLLLDCWGSLAQNKSSKSEQPKVVLDLKKSRTGEKSFASARFGVTCRSSEPRSSQYSELRRPASISELLGAPVELVRIHRFGPRWKKSEEARKHLIKILETQTDTIYRYEAWAEFVMPDIVATVRFSDKSEGALEESGGHVCFTDHSKSAAWARVSQN